jgi:superfamily II DNA/RNA helicase
VKELAIVLKRNGLNARAMHSDLDQAERDEVMNLFRAHKVDLLVATDIVARGIDIDDITMVINYDAPHDAEDYVHRIGRTARAGRQGSAITLIGEKDLLSLSNIERTLKIKIPREELPEGVRPPQTGKDARNHGHNRNGRSKNGQSRNHRGNTEHGRNESHGRNDARNSQGGKPHGKSDNRPAAKRRPPKSGNGRKPQ